MSELISGKDALIALANGEEVQSRLKPYDTWNSCLKFWTVNEILSYDGDFRLKPRTVTLNGIEVPMPFKPKEFEDCYMLSDLYEHGYTKTSWKYSKSVPAWRTEDEIKQVVAVLRSVLNTK